MHLFFPRLLIFLLAQASALLLVPSGNAIAGQTADAGSGLAARYPGDKGIGYDPDVLLADDFESYTSPSQLTANWSSAYQLPNTRIATEAGNCFAGGKALEFSLPVSTRETSNALNKTLSPAQDTVFLRAYTKFDSGYQVKGSNHNGLRLSGNYPGPGVKAPADGTGFFLFLLQNNIQGNGRPGETDPGYSHIYAYWPRQRDNFGDHWFPDGFVVPYSSALGADGSLIGNRGDWQAFSANYPEFQSGPNFLPQRNRWYCYELMVKANTPGLRDGEVKYWIDGKVLSDFPNLNIRSTPTLKIDTAHIGLHALHSERVNKKWYDNVVIATKYIGPMASGTPTPAPTPRPTPTATPTPIATPSATPRPTATPTRSATATPTATPTATLVATPTPIATIPPTPTPNPTPTPIPTPTPTATPTPTDPPPVNGSPVIEGLEVVNAPAGTNIAPLTNECTLYFNTGLSIRADASATKSVTFKLDGVTIKTENVAPYTIAGNQGEVYHAWRPSPGRHFLVVTPFSGSNGSGIKGSPKAVRFTAARTP